LKSEPINVDLPKYSKFKEEIYDVPIKTQIDLRILVSGQITQIGLERLLNQLYFSNIKRTGFKYHDHPTAIFLYAYTSKEYAESGDKWVAMLQKSHGAGSHSTQTNENLIAQNCLRPMDKFGLPESTRKEIWRQLVLVEDRSFREAERIYPDDFYKQARKADELQQKYERDLAKKYGLNSSQLQDISIEGAQKDWPLPTP
jgi:hypothetical protein